MLKLNVITGAHVDVGVLGNMSMPRLTGLAPSMGVGYHVQAHVTWAQIVFMFLGILNVFFFWVF